MKITIVTVLLFVILGCAEVKEKTEIPEVSDPLINENELQDTVNLEDTIPAHPQVTVTNDVSILFATSYSADELDQNTLNKKWVGLFMDNEGDITCHETALEIKAVYDPMSDEEGEMSGKQIICKGLDPAPLFLVNGIENLNGRKIQPVEGLKSQLLPGESMQLGAYTIEALGKIEENNWNAITDYKLLISGPKEGEIITQTLLEQDFFDDAMFQFHWAGDIDDDGIPDLYMDISYKYSFSNPALFLSSKAGENEWLKLVAEYTLYGC